MAHAIASCCVSGSLRGVMRPRIRTPCSCAAAWLRLRQVRCMSHAHYPPPEQLCNCLARNCEQRCCMRVLACGDRRCSCNASRACRLPMSMYYQRTRASRPLSPEHCLRSIVSGALSLETTRHHQNAARGSARIMSSCCDDRSGGNGAFMSFLPQRRGAGSLGNHLQHVLTRHT